MFNVQHGHKFCCSMQESSVSFCSAQMSRQDPDAQPSQRVLILKSPTCLAHFPYRWEPRGQHRSTPKLPPALSQPGTNPAR